MTGAGEVRGPVLCAVIGSPVAHSRSPAIHTAAFAAAGLDWRFLAVDVPAGGAAAALRAAAALGVRGLSVTMPLKEEVAGLVDELEPAAARLAAVNCVTVDGGRLVGANTDGDGFVDALREAGADPAGRRCLVLGAGGAARAVILALATAGAAEVVVAGRTPARVAAAAALAGPAGRVGTEADATAADLVVNATPVGMGRASSTAVDPTPVLMGAAGATTADLVGDTAAADLAVDRTPVGTGGAGATTADLVGDAAAADLVVHSTPVGTGVGTGGDPGLPLDPALLRPGQVVADLVYQPLVTPLLAAAERAGAIPVGGLGMLVHQAAHAFRRWTGLAPPVAAMAAAAHTPGTPGAGA